MLKLIKYEIKTYYKMFIGLFVIAALLNSFLLYKQTDWMEGVSTTFISFVMFGTMLVIALFSIMSFNKEIYEDRGYLTFTIPVTTKQILSSKVLVSIMWFFIGGIITGSFAMISASKLLPDDALEAFRSYINFNNVSISLIQSLLTILFFLGLIYFSITLSRVTFRGRKFGKAMAFVFFIAFVILYFYLTIKIMLLMPYSLQFDLMRSFEYSINNDVVRTGGLMNINVASSIFSIIFVSGLYLSTWYLIDKKIDL